MLNTQPMNWWSVPYGQIQPQNTRPSSRVGTRMNSERHNQRYTVWVDSAVANDTSGSSSRNSETG